MTDHPDSPSPAAAKPVVLHVVEAFATGILQSIAHICNGLQDDIDFVILHGARPETPADFPSFYPLGTRFVRWDVAQTLSPVANRRSFRQLRALAAEINPVAIHAHSSTAGAMARLAFPGRASRVFYSPRCFAYLRQDISPWLKAVYIGLEWCLGRLPSPTLTACGYDEFRHMRRIARRSVCIPNGVEPAAISATANGIKKSAEFTVVDSGRIFPQKNFGMFVDVAARFRDRGIRFLWIGEATLGGALETALEGRTMPDNIHITGWLPPDETLRTMATADVFLHTALWEGMSRTCLEAAALGLPLLLMPADGARELVPEDGKTGYQCRSIDAFTAALEKLLADRTLGLRMGAAARALVEDKEATVSELTLRPLNARAWWRLAVLESYRAGRPTAKSAAYLIRSVAVAPQALTMMPVRVVYLLTTWPQFNPAQRRAAQAQVAATWRAYPDEILRLASNPHLRGLLRTALAADPEQLAAFEAALLRPAKKKR